MNKQLIENNDKKVIDYDELELDEIIKADSVILKKETAGWIQGYLRYKKLISSTDSVIIPMGADDTNVEDDNWEYECSFEVYDKTGNKLVMYGKAIVVGYAADEEDMLYASVMVIEDVYAVSDE